MKISLLVPFRPDGSRDGRIKAWKWVEQRWGVILPEAEIVVGTDDGGFPFSKSVAVNDAFRKSSGDMLVIADADSWVERETIIQGIENAARKEHLVVPWWKSHRLHKEDSLAIMKTDPHGELPVTDEMREACQGEGPTPASAAMVLCIQRSAFERVGGMDPRFRGWGSEDVSFGLACWTLLGRNEYHLGEAFALYHPTTTTKEGMRVWSLDKGNLNADLYNRYWAAQGDVPAMTALCSEHPIGNTPIGPASTLRQEDLLFLSGHEKAPATAPIVQETQGPLNEGESFTL